ncbi:MAG TPA: carboxypeptidase-like regulatory domain-containing protein [Gemmataceae bacterium]|nr:carboxypeptidase-like regulatory domain-containing protein [Gemmataceae bacterium]
MADRIGRVGWLVAVFVFAVVVLSGCGSGGPKLHPVHGKVTLTDGAPVKYGHIILHADASKGNTTKEVPQGTIRNGDYTIMTGAREGAPPGAYRVSIEAADEVDEKNPYFTKWFAHEKYVNPDTSKLTMEVVESPEPGRYDFKLDPHPPQIDPFNPTGKKK